MALAAMCSDLQSKYQAFGHAFKGFIVDHGVRKGSDQEARNVAAELERIGIPVEILKLAWGGPDPRTIGNFETVARRLRYRALGAASWNSQINELLVAHHADDEAETVLSRILTGYMGYGLQGIKIRSPIPECEGIYGVDASGHREYEYAQSEKGSPKRDPRLSSNHSIAIERGGVNIYRPLLPFTKAQLIAICQQKKVTWFEDHTNADQTLTIRNSVRSLMKEGSLPEVVKSGKLLSMAHRLQHKQHHMEKVVQRLFQMMPIKLNTVAGKASIQVHDRLGTHNRLGIHNFSPQEIYNMNALLLRRMLLLVSPSTAISLQDLDHAMSLVFPRVTPSLVPDSMSLSKVQVAGVSIEWEGFGNGSTGRNLSLSRSIPTKTQVKTCLPIPYTSWCHIDRKSPNRNTADTTEQHESTFTSGNWSEWVLWDSRYWIRIQIPRDLPDGSSYAVRFLTPDPLGALRKTMGRESLQSSERGRLERHLERVTQPQRWTMPAIWITINGEEHLAALPAIHWSRSVQYLPCPEYEIRYKSVELDRENEEIPCTIR